MICNKCNFQNEETAKFCRSCGVELKHKQIQETLPETNALLDKELISLLQKGEKKQALKLYKDRMGASDYKSRYHVAHLNFFLKHKDTTENVWQEYVKKSKRKYIWSRIIQWFLLAAFLFLAAISIDNLFYHNSYNDYQDYKRVNEMFQEFQNQNNTWEDFCNNIEIIKAIQKNSHYRYCLHGSFQTFQDEMNYYRSNYYFDLSLMLLGFIISLIIVFWIFKTKKIKI